MAGNDAATLLKPRHRVIAFEVVRHIVPTGVKYEAVLALLKQLSGDITPNAIKGRSPAYLAYRGLINSEGLSTLFGGDTDTVISLYQEIEPFYRDHFLFWLHYAMAYIGEILTLARPI